MIGFHSQRHGSVVLQICRRVGRIRARIASMDHHRANTDIRPITVPDVKRARPSSQFPAFERQKKVEVTCTQGHRRWRQADNPWPFPSRTTVYRIHYPGTLALVPASHTRLECEVPMILIQMRQDHWLVGFPRLAEDQRIEVIQCWRAEAFYVYGPAKIKEKTRMFVLIHKGIEVGLPDVVDRNAMQRHIDATKRCLDLRRLGSLTQKGAQVIARGRRASCLVLLHGHVESFRPTSLTRAITNWKCPHRDGAGEVAVGKSD